MFPPLLTSGSLRILGVLGFSFSIGFLCLDLGYLKDNEE